jgi:cyclic beta-1,2-glucan synthetase
LYRAGIESILGFHKQGDHLLLSPCIPNHWRRFEITFRHATARYEIVVENPSGVSQGVVSIVVDDTPLPDRTSRILLQDDGAHHRVQVVLGTGAWEVVSLPPRSAA